MDKKAKMAALIGLVLLGLLVAGMVIAAPQGKGAGKKECRDGVDNDGDGAIDLADAGCSSSRDNDETNCGDGVCEGGETTISCSADCGLPDSCSDTDNGYYVLQQGTVSGVLDGQTYSYTDNCLSATTLSEYWCVGAHAAPEPVDCTSLNYTGCNQGACIQ